MRLGHCSSSSSSSTLLSSGPPRLASLAVVLLSLWCARGAHAANVTALTGTWSTGNGDVLTGPTFGEPTNNTFNYPAVAGMAFSFTDDGYFEEAQFRWNSNATEPYCVQAYVIWQHGSYKLQSNGSITTDPDTFEGDGRIQVQDACAPTSNAIYYYSQRGLYLGWDISVWRDKYMLRLQSFDGSYLPRLYRVSDAPADYMFPLESMSGADSQYGLDSSSGTSSDNSGVNVGAIRARHRLR